MVTPRTIRCKVITIYAHSPLEKPASATPAPAADASRPRFRPSDMVPWADPYIAGLVRKLQREVRDETAAAPRKATTRFGAPVADLEWPWDEGVTEYETVDREPVEAEAPGAGSNWNLAAPATR